MICVIKKGNLYVSRPGSEQSYTWRLEEARFYPTRQEAEKDLCPENEMVVPLNTILPLDSI